MELLEVALGLTAGFMFAAGTVLQGRVAETESEEAALKAGFLLRLVRKPLWLGGVAIDAIGFVAQAIALGVGRLAVVQPLLASTVVFALPLGAWLADKPIRRRDVFGALAVTGGLAGFLIIGNPSEGRDDASVRGWLIAGGAVALTCGLLVAIGARQKGAPRAALFGTAAGILFGVSAGLTKATVDQLEEGVLTIFVDWHLYALIVVGFASITLTQASLQTGKFPPAIATSTTLDPIASLILGVTIFGERLAGRPLHLIAAIVCLHVMIGGLVVLSSSEDSGEGSAGAGDSGVASGLPPPGDT